MNPAFDPMAARRPATAGGTPLAPQLMAGAQQQQLAQTPGPAPQAGSPPVARPTPGPSVPNLNTGRAPTGGAPSPAPAPTGGWTPPSQYARFYGGGNIGQSAPGSVSSTGHPAFHPGGPNYEYQPWMEDTSVQWGGGPHGYLPIGYVPQNFDYYAQGNYGSRLAPWEYQYWKDTWTQNFDPNAPGFVDTQRGANDPNYYQNLRG